MNQKSKASGEFCKTISIYMKQVSALFKARGEEEKSVVEKPYPDEQKRKCISWV